MDLYIHFSIRLCGAVPSYLSTGTILHVIYMKISVFWDKTPCSVGDPY
jgi:hypothetical protein